jgi:hypothetical protein
MRSQVPVALPKAFFQAATSHPMMLLPQRARRKSFVRRELVRKQYE